MALAMTCQSAARALAAARQPGGVGPGSSQGARRLQLQVRLDDLADRCMVFKPWKDDLADSCMVFNAWKVDFADSCMVF